MDREPEVTIVMGSHNPRREWLQRAVASLVAQTWENWELVLWDDGSSPQGARLLSQAAGRDSRIHLYRGEINRGLAHALNQGISRARGRYIARMDDDDISLPRRLETQVAFLQAHPQQDWVGSAALLRDEKGVWGTWQKPVLPQREDFLHSSPYIHPSVMFRRQVLELIGGYGESSRYLGCEDYELFFRLHQAGFRGYNLPQPLLEYWEDRASHRRRTYARRVREAAVRRRGYRMLSLSGLRAWGGVLRPLGAGLIPSGIRYRLKGRNKGGNRDER